MELPAFHEVFDLLGDIAERLYLFISRSEVQALAKLGYLGEFLAQLAATDLSKAQKSMTERRWKEQQGMSSFFKAQQEDNLRQL